MAFSSDNLPACIEPWSFHRPAFLDSWITDAFLRDTEETMTKALQKSISDAYDPPLLPQPASEATAVVEAAMPMVDLLNSYYNFNYTNSNSNFDPLPDIAAAIVGKADTSPLSGGSGSSDAETVSKGSSQSAAAKGVKKGKAMKRKSRPSKRSPTTFITTDAADFRRMVQQVTGAKYLNGQMPTASVLKPEPKRLISGAGAGAGGGGGGGGYVNVLHGFVLPTTLDTSAFLLDHHDQKVMDPTAAAVAVGPSSAAGDVAFAPPLTAADGAGPSNESEHFASFPTLESWEVM
ncbi:hypothetical protein Ancab_031205 [Ancistrocladus abbreviatus]